MWKIKTVLIALVLGFSSLWAEIQNETARDILAELDAYLTFKNMKKLIPAKELNRIYRLAQDEDMELKDQYLVSDDLLVLLKKKGILNSPFGVLIEKLQSHADTLSETERDEVLYEWKTLWLEKTSQYVRYNSSLKRKWTFDYSHTIDHDSNVVLQPNDSSTSRHADDDAAGLSNSINFTLRPWINQKKLKDWDFRTQISGYSKRVSRVKSVQSDNIGLGQIIGYKTNEGWIRSTQFSWNFKRSFSENPDNRRMEFEQHSLNLRLGFAPTRFSKGFFNSSRFRARLGLRFKSDFKDDTVATSMDEDSDAFVLNVGQTLGLRSSKAGRTLMQSIGWNINYETQSTEPSLSRDYSFVNFGVNYTHSFKPGFIKRPMSWRTSLDYRVKSWDQPNVATPDDEGQLYISTSLRASWSTNWSSRFSFSYLRKDQDLNGGGTQDIDQFRLAWTNTFLTH